MRAWAAVLLVALGLVALLCNAAGIRDLDDHTLVKISTQMDPKTYAAFRRLCTHHARLCPPFTVTNQMTDIVTVVFNTNALRRSELTNLNRRIERVLGVDSANPFRHALLLADVIGQVESRVLSRINPLGFGYVRQFWPGRPFAEAIARYTADQMGLDVESCWFPDTNGFAVPPFGVELSHRARAFVKMFKAYLAKRPAALTAKQSAFWFDSLMHCIFGNLPWQVRLHRLGMLHDLLSAVDARPRVSRLAARQLMEMTLTDVLGSYLMPDSYPWNRLPPKLDEDGSEYAFVLRPDDDHPEGRRYLHFEMVPFSDLEHELHSDPDSEVARPIKRFVGLQRLLGFHRQLHNEFEAQEETLRAISDPRSNRHLYEAENSVCRRLWASTWMLGLMRQFKLPHAVQAIPVALLGRIDLSLSLLSVNAISPFLTRQQRDYSMKAVFRTLIVGSSLYTLIAASMLDWVVRSRFFSNALIPIVEAIHGQIDQARIEDQNEDSGNNE